MSVKLIIIGLGLHQQLKQLANWLDCFIFKCFGWC